MNKINTKVAQLENDPDYASWVSLFTSQTKYATDILTQEKEAIKRSKAKRNAEKEKEKEIKPSFLEILNEQSKSEQLKLKRLKRYWKNRLAFIQSQILTYEEVILQLKKNENQNQTRYKKDYSVSINPKLQSGMGIIMGYI